MGPATGHHHCRITRNIKSVMEMETIQQQEQLYWPDRRRHLSTVRGNQEDRVREVEEVR